MVKRGFLPQNSKVQEDNADKAVKVRWGIDDQEKVQKEKHVIQRKKNKGKDGKDDEVNSLSNSPESGVTIYQPAV